MAAGSVFVYTALVSVFLDLISKGSCIDCFECLSVAGNDPHCEDQFGPDNETEFMLHRKCRIGYLQRRAFYCVKIKGVKDNGDTIMIRTCSMDNWGTNCGDIHITQPTTSKDVITGCLASCDYDSCNHGNSIHNVLGYFVATTLGVFILVFNS